MSPLEEFAAMYSALASDIKILKPIMTVQANLNEIEIIPGQWILCTDTKEYYNDVERILDMSIREERKIAFESLNYTIPESLMDNKDLIEKDNVLIIYGTKEDLNCTKSAIDLKNIFINAKLVEIIRGNHLWNIIDYKLFNTITRDFIKYHHIKENSKIRIYQGKELLSEENIIKTLQYTESQGILLLTEVKTTIRIEVVDGCIQLSDIETEGKGEV
jgi:hypothetical protein